MPPLLPLCIASNTPPNQILKNSSPMFSTPVGNPDVREGSLMELLYAGIIRWAMEKCSGRKRSEGKCSLLLFEKESSVLKVDPCGVCGEQVGCNSIQCTKCQQWVYHYCCVPKQVSLLSCQDIFVCRPCLGHNSGLPLFSWAKNEEI